MSFVHSFLSGLSFRIAVFRLRREQSIDILVEHGGRQTIFWPISPAADKAVPEALRGYPRKWGGYAVPRSAWKPLYDALHHGPCPLIGCFSPLFGMLIDTP